MCKQSMAPVPKKINKQINDGLCTEVTGDYVRPSITEVITPMKMSTANWSCHGTPTGCAGSLKEVTCDSTSILNISSAIDTAKHTNPLITIQDNFLLTQVSNFVYSQDNCFTPQTGFSVCEVKMSLSVQKETLLTDAIKLNQKLSLCTTNFGKNQHFRQSLYPCFNQFCVIKSLILDLLIFLEVIFENPL